MKISIVTPSYNQGRFIKTTLESILQQSYPHLENIVIDGGSTDNTLDILRTTKDNRLIWISEPDNGQSDAINKGMRQASGDILAYLNSDDVYLPGTLAFVADYFTQHPAVDVLYGSCYTIDGDGQRVPPDYLAKPITLRQFMTKRFKFPQQGVFWRRKALDEIGLFAEDLHYRMDYDYWLRMVIAGYRFAPVPDFLAAYRVHDSSKSVTQDAKFWRDWQTIIERIYARTDLPTEITALKPLAFAYVDHYAAESYFDHGERPAARPHLRRILSGAGTTPLKVLSAVMLVDSYLHTPFNALLKAVYRRTKGNDV
ncbi:MAG: glycosyltransferase family 2 protein [Anaerolineae bacterium]